MLKKSSDLQHMDLSRTGSYMGYCAYAGYGRPGVLAMDRV